MRTLILAAFAIACLLPAAAADEPEAADPTCIRSNTTVVPAGACVYEQPAACWIESGAFGFYVDVGCYPCGLDVNGSIRILCY